MSPQRLLIVEDDTLVQSLMGAVLQRDGFDVSLATTGREMLAAVDSERIDLVLLDLTLPDEDGLSLARQLRARSDMPILIVTARQEEADRTAAMEIGADDYITKPFEPEDLVRRVRELVGVHDESSSVRQDQVAYDFDGWQVKIEDRTVTDPDGLDVPFTRAEFNILAALLKAPNRALSRGHLLDAISHDADSPTERLIDVLISRIRKKLEPASGKPKYIVTVVGCGYKFNNDST